MSKPTEEQIEELIDAMVCVLNDFEGGGNSVCDLVKAKATLAIQPFLFGDSGYIPETEWAEKVVADCTY